MPVSACDISTFLNKKSAVSNCACEVKGDQSGCEPPKRPRGGAPGSRSYPSASHGVPASVGLGRICSRGRIGLPLRMGWCMRWVAFSCLPKSLWCPCAWARCCVSPPDEQQTFLQSEHGQLDMESRGVSRDELRKKFKVWWQTQFPKGKISVAVDIELCEVKSNTYLTIAVVQGPTQRKI